MSFQALAGPPTDTSRIDLLEKLEHGDARIMPSDRICAIAHWRPAAWYATIARSGASESRVPGLLSDFGPIGFAPLTVYGKTPPTFERRPVRNLPRGFIMKCLFVTASAILVTVLSNSSVWAQDNSATNAPAAAEHPDEIVRMHQQVAAANRVYNRKVAAAQKVFDEKKAAAREERDAAIAEAHRGVGQ